MDNNCLECQRYYDFKEVALRDAESVFDAVIDLEDMIRDCKYCCMFTPKNNKDENNK